ncbi:EF-hand domain-containing protein [Sphingorhabdus sp.]|jgi:Ca2+-binding EF-hand superfamily protein|uniref:EF-hand domain-containing protein n=1 Tax=Sphingorhabdus sp. TaxID=1902408 RepID=UPI0037CA3D2D
MTSPNIYIARPVFKLHLVRSCAFIAAVAFAQSANGYVMQGAATKAAAPKNQVQAAQPQKPSVSQDLARSSFIQLMDAEFKKRDLDGNGKATRAEVEEYTKRAATAEAKQKNQELFSRLDVDKNGLISPAEFAALVPAPQFVDVSAEMIRFDKNRDQIITLVEYRTTTLANFDRLDADKDGILSAAEMTSLNAATPSSKKDTDQSR